MHAEKQANELDHRMTITLTLETATSKITTTVPAVLDCVKPGQNGYACLRLSTSFLSAWYVVLQFSSIEAGRGRKTNMCLYAGISRLSSIDISPLKHRK